MYITSETQKIIQKYIKCKKYKIHLGRLEMSLQDLTMVILILQDRYHATKNEELKHAINELSECRYNATI